MADYIVEMTDISKFFPGVKALDKAQLRLQKGRVMALLGENGAGKSTIMKILSGNYTKDEGTIKIDGKDVGDLTPNTSRDLGISIIHQELSMCPHLTVAENIFLGNEPKKNPFMISKKEMRERTQKVLDRLNITDFTPDTIIGTLSVSKQQMVEIAKATSMNSRVLIMDEPTSALSDTEIQKLFEIIRGLKAEGCAIVYISHRLAELEHIVDDVTIMRDGQYVSSCEFKDITLDEIVSQMVGREIKEKFPRVTTPKGKLVFEVKDLNAGPMVQNVNLKLYEGEIVSLAGLMGAGRTEVTQAIFGAAHKDSGQIFIDGQEVKINSPKDAIRHGLVLAPEDRRTDGLCLGLSVKQNICLPNMDILTNRFGVVNRAKEAEMTNKTIDNLHIRLANPEVTTGTLSGGNQQKVVVGKWLARDSRVVIFDEPTRGIDVAAKVEIYNIMNELKQQGIAVLFVSSELPEVLGIADRIVVMCDGRITGEMMVEDATQEKILSYATMFADKMNTAI